MFNGIIEETGTIEGIIKKKNLSVLKVRANKVLAGVKNGASIAVNGVCLTVSGVKKGVINFDVMRESLLRTTLGTLKAKSRVNLERALKANGRIDGHFVTGHVDAVGVIKNKISKTNYTKLVIGMTKELAKHIVSKGSVCIDGISLTVGTVNRSAFSVYLVPFTKDVTTIGLKKKGDHVNIETDILAKYILNKN